MSISAKNYAAQAQAGLREWAKRANESHVQDAKAVMDISEQIGIAVHFALPDNGRILGDGLKGLKGLELRLPYPSITVEYYVNEKASFNSEMQLRSPKRLAFAFDIPKEMFDDDSDFCDGGIIIFAANYILSEYGDGWVPVPMGVAIPRRWDGFEGLKMFPGISQSEEGKKAFAFTPIPLCHQVTDDIIKKYGAEKGALYAIKDVQDEATAVLELCEALSCSNVDSEVVETIDQRKNERRIRQGKLPLYETRRLVIKAPLTRSAGSSAGCISDRQGPREHLRRGHIRRLQDGRRVWVQSCVVGNRANGVINKQYGVMAS